MTERALFVCPHPTRELSPNGRVHHMVLHQAKKKLMEACWKAALPYVGKIKGRPAYRMHLTFHPKPRSRWDDDNAEAAFKAGRDGIALALGVDDNCITATREIGTKMNPPRVLVELWDVSDGE